MRKSQCVRVLEGGNHIVLGCCNEEITVCEDVVMR